MFIGPPTGPSATLARALEPTSIVAVPEPPLTDGWAWNWRDTIDGWRAGVAGGPPVDQVVVCTWPEAVSVAAVIDLDPATWRVRVEWPLALWFHALAAATQCCADGGAIVAVVEVPGATEAAGHGPVVTVAEGILALVRSLAAGEGGRAVRVNAVTTDVLTSATELAGAKRPPASFAGRPDVEVAGAVRLLLSAEAGGVTGTELRIAGGRP